MENDPTGFRPRFEITAEIARGLMRIEAAAQAVEMLPITPRAMAHLRDTARLYSTHYSTMIEGNRLTQVQVQRVIGAGEHFPGSERDEDEVRGYYAALQETETLARSGAALTEPALRRLHALVMSRGRTRVRPTVYRDGQNVIRDSRSGDIVYLPPEAGDVPGLMRQLLAWVNAKDELPVPLKAAIAHYQFATVHPFYDGNGRTARLMTSLILHLGGYGLKGLYALEEYYARNLETYYRALTIGPSHNYYLGRAEADITSWVGYFIAGMADSFEKVREQARREAMGGGVDGSGLLRDLDPRQRRVMALFEHSREVTSKEMAALFGLQQRSAAALCQRWTEQGFLVIAEAAKKSRRYRLEERFERQFRRC
jgi:Fic family protein